MFQCAVVVTINTVIIFEPRCKHRFEDIEVKNFATVSTIVAHRSEDYDCLSVSLSFVCLDMCTYSYASVTFTNNLSRRRLMVVQLVE